MSAKGAAGQSINIEKELLGDFVHVVERAAISSARTMGQGDAEAADQAAVQAMRKAFEGVRMAGTIVIGADVRISRVAVSYGTLTVQVTESPQVIQPAPFSRGQTAVQPQTDIMAMQEGSKVAIVEGPDLRTLVAGLNSIGLKADGIIAILQGIKSAGALQAELVLQ